MSGHGLRGVVELAADVRGLSAVYYATLLVVAAGLTVLLGYEIGWLAARSGTALVMAAVLVPWVVFAACPYRTTDNRAPARLYQPTKRLRRSPGPRVSWLGRPQKGRRQAGTITQVSGGGDRRI